MAELPSVNNSVESSQNGFLVFIDCRNLLNQRYASSIDVIPDARTSPDSAYFPPPATVTLFTVEFRGVGKSLIAAPRILSGNPYRFRVCEFANSSGAELASGNSKDSGSVANWPVQPCHTAQSPSCLREKG